MIFISPDVLSFGEPMLEFNAFDIGSLSKVEKFEVGWGGDTSNFAIAASRTGTKVGIIASVGNDEFGTSFMDLWKREGIDTSVVSRKEELYTAVYYISRKQDGTHDFDYIRKGSAASHFSPDDMKEEYFQNCKVFHTSGITQAISNSSCDAAFKAMEICKKKGILVSYDPNLRLKLWPIHRARAVINYSFELADIVFPSFEDAQVITGKKEPNDIVDEILKRGPEIVVLKMGENGCLVATQEERFICKTIEIEDVIDTSGAGDAFSGGFITSYLENRDLKKAAIFANIVGALTTRGKGCVRPIPYREEVLEKLKVLEGEYYESITN